MRVTRASGPWAISRVRRWARASGIPLLVGASVGCTSLSEAAFDGTLRAFELAGHLPFALSGGINSLPFAVYLPEQVLGHDPDLGIQGIEPGEQISFSARYQVPGGTGQEALHVEITEEQLRLDRGFADRTRICLSGQANPLLCPALVRSPLGRTVFSSHQAPWTLGLFFAIDETLVRVSIYHYHPSKPQASQKPLEISSREVVAFVDSFVQVSRFRLYRMRAEPSG